MPVVTEPTYTRTGPLLSYWPLLEYIETNLGRRVNSDPDLATLLPVTYRTVHRWRTQGIRLATAQRIATHFACTPTDIWGADWAKGTHLT